MSIIKQTNEVGKALPQHIDKSLTRLSDILDKHPRPISGFKKDNGEENVIQIISLIIAKAQNMLGVQNKMNGEAIKATAGEILKDYYFFSYEDIRAALMDALKTRQFYGKFDFNDVMTCMAEWSTKRLDEAERRSIQKHNRNKETRDMRKFKGQ